MELETAAFWLDSIAIGAVVVWLVGWWFVRSTETRCAEPRSEHVTVDGDGRHVAAAFARALAEARAGTPLMGSTLDKATDTEVRWHSRGPLRHEGHVRLASQGRTTRIDVEVTARSGTLTVARWIVMLGALTTTALYVLLRLWVLPSEHPAARGQVLQMVQAVHVLWPPFLLAGITRRLHTTVAVEAKRVLTNAARLVPGPAAVTR
jgi:hypothetical protein